MTNADKHVRALIDRFGPPPFHLDVFDCTIHALSAEGNTVRASVEWAPGRRNDWLVPEPEVLLPDPEGAVVREYPLLDENGEPLMEGDDHATYSVRFREDCIAIASAELASYLRMIRK